jgi:hypothetical protein
MWRDAVMRTRFGRMPARAGLAAALLAAGLLPGARGGDNPAIGKIMEQVNISNRAIGKGLRATSALEASGRNGLAADAASLARLGREARTLTGPARGQRKPQQEWTRAVDDFLQSSEDLAGVLADPGSSRPRAAQSYQKLQKTCIRCHRTFREQAD